MRKHRWLSLEGCTAEMQQPAPPPFEAPHGARCAPWLAPQDDGGWDLAMQIRRAAIHVANGSIQALTG